jgi:hypothetical protein
MIATAVRRAIVWTILVASTLYIAITLTPAAPADPGAAWKDTGMVEVLYDHRDECWTADQTPLADIPTHVIARTPSTPWSYRGLAATKRGLDQLFGDTPNDPIIILAFCR